MADGFNDPLKSIFGKEVESVFRESFQNSIDAVEDRNKPVIIHVNLETFTAEEIPSSAQLKKIFVACSGSENVKAKNHFNEAIKILDSNEIPVLKISDFNTKGLTGGDEEKGGNFYNFFKAVGSHNKGDTAGGSYGYGKSTNLAHSRFDLFFAHSSFSNQGSVSNVFMGCIRVCSHNADGIEMRGIGSFGLPGQKAIRDRKLIPRRFRRDSSELGTDIFIPAYRHHGEWQDNTIKAVLKNFWLAILRKKLVVKIGDIFINDGNLDENMLRYFVDSVGSWKVDSPFPFYVAYMQGRKAVHRKDKLGEVECYIISDKDGHTNSFACFRQNLMLIQHKRINSVIPYTGLFLCNDPNGNAILKKMEPPLHDSWSKKEVNALDQDTGKPSADCADAERELSETLKAEVKSLLSSKSAEVIKLDSLNSMISLSGGEGVSGLARQRGDQGGGESVARESDKVRRIQVKLKPSHEFHLRFEGGANGGGNAARNDSSKPKGDDDEIRKPSEVDGRKLERSQVRTMLVGKQGRRWVRIIVRTEPPRPGARVKLALNAGTDDSFQKVQIVNVYSEDGNAQIGVDQSSIENLESDEDGKVTVEVEFHRNQIYSLKTTVYEVE